MAGFESFQLYAETVYSVQRGIPCAVAIGTGYDPKVRYYSIIQCAELTDAEAEKLLLLAPLHLTRARTGNHPG